jgi:hypothetical protein
MHTDLRLSCVALAAALAAAALVASTVPSRAGDDDARIVADCFKLVKSGARKIAEVRTDRFEG